MNTPKMTLDGAIEEFELQLTQATSEAMGDLHPGDGVVVRIDAVEIVLRAATAMRALQRMGEYQKIDDNSGDRFGTQFILGRSFDRNTWATDDEWFCQLIVDQEIGGAEEPMGYASGDDMLDVIEQAAREAGV